MKNLSYKLIVLVLAAILLASPIVYQSRIANGQSPQLSSSEITLPEKVEVLPLRVAKIEAVTSANKVFWICPEEITLISSESGKWVIVQAEKAGKYRIWALVAKGEQVVGASTCLVVGQLPKPIPPKPNPVPPSPTPPTTSLLGKLQAAYKSDNQQDKADSLKRLVASYEAILSSLGNQNLKTWGDLFDLRGAVETQMGISGKILEVRKLIAAELAKSFPKEDGASLNQDLARSTINSILTALKGVK